MLYWALFLIFTVYYWNWGVFLILVRLIVTGTIEKKTFEVNVPKHLLAPLFSTNLDHHEIITTKLYERWTFYLPLPW